MYPLSPLSLSIQGFPNGSVVNNLPAMQETQVQSLDKMIPWRGNGNPLQYSCLKNPMDRGAWRVTVQRVTELDPTEQRSTSTHLSIYLPTVIMTIIYSLSIYLSIYHLPSPSLSVDLSSSLLTTEQHQSIHLFIIIVIIIYSLSIYHPFIQSISSQYLFPVLHFLKHYSATL